MTLNEIFAVAPCSFAHLSMLGGIKEDLSIACRGHADLRFTRSFAELWFDPVLSYLMDNMILYKDFVSLNKDVYHTLLVNIESHSFTVENVSVNCLGKLY